MKNKLVLVIILLALLAVAGFALFNSSKQEEVPAEESDIDMVHSQEEEMMEESEEDEVLMDETDEMDSEAMMEGGTKGGDMMGEIKEFTLDSFSFGYSVEEIRVKKGDTVTINLTNSNGFHDWVLDEFGAATAKIPVGETASVTFVASETGEFEYYCSVGSHRANGMVGKLIVE